MAASICSCSGTVGAWLQRAEGRDTALRGEAKAGRARCGDELEQEKIPRLSFNLPPRAVEPKMRCCPCSFHPPAETSVRSLERKTLKEEKGEKSATSVLKVSERDCHPLCFLPPSLPLSCGWSVPCCISV